MNLIGTTTLYQHCFHTRLVVQLADALFAAVNHTVVLADRLALFGELNPDLLVANGLRRLGGRLWPGSVVVVAGWGRLVLVVVDHDLQRRPSHVLRGLLSEHTCVETRTFQLLVC